MENGHDEIFEPKPEFSRNAHVKSLEEYKKLYAQSIENPQAFWSDISRIHLPSTIMICPKGQSGSKALALSSSLIQVAASSGSLAGKQTFATMLSTATSRWARATTLLTTGSATIQSQPLECRPFLLTRCKGVPNGQRVEGLWSEEGRSRCHLPPYGHSVACGHACLCKNRGDPFRLKPLMEQASPTCPVEWMQSEDPLFMLYTSGSTGKPKGVLHTTAGYMIWSYTTFKYTFDYHPGIATKIMGLCDSFPADCRRHLFLYCGLWLDHGAFVHRVWPDAQWRHTGPLLHLVGVALLTMVSSDPICEQYKVTQFYTAPTAIRALLRYGDEPVQRCDLSSLKILGSVGEPINSEAWKWYYSVVGSSRCPIVDTWWQTETGGHMITPLPGATPLKPGSASFPMFGVVPTVLDADGREITEMECEGYLAIKQPWPGQMRTVYGDHDRDKDGYYWLTGRVDDVINVSGHRIGTAEVENKLDEHPDCTEAAVVGYPHAVKGEGIYAYVILRDGSAGGDVPLLASNVTAGVEPSDRLRQELKNKVRNEIGAFAQPDIIHWTPGLPKTRSGKIMRRILRKIAAGQTMMDDLGDIT
eukprot:746509-Hanusia_phi.AAC.3